MSSLPMAGTSPRTTVPHRSGPRRRQGRFGGEFFQDVHAAVASPVGIRDVTGIGVELDRALVPAALALAAVTSET